MPCQELPYFPDTAALFAPLAQQPWAVWLDSCQPYAEQGRYDILSAAPVQTLQTQGQHTEIRRHDQLEISDADPLHLLQHALDRFPATPPDCPVPFAGGAIGYFAYDLARRWEQLPVLADNAEQLPEMAVGIYDWALVVDHQEQRTYLASSGHNAVAFAHWKTFFSHPQPAPISTPFRLQNKLLANFSQSGYQQAFQRIQDYIVAGDCYQVNLAQRFTAPAQGDPWSLYLRLRQQNPAPFAAFFNTPQAQVLSSSPERFLSLRNGQVETKPIKGTRPRCLDDAQQDAAIGQALLTSAKDRAENLMIVDLLRNDLSKVCALGSVRVPHLCALERFARVHHLVSTVTGQLRPEHSAVELLRACFPGGSITGAPKRRAMQIIEELEPQRRGLYCGSLGYLGFDGNMDLNIAIRTLIYAQQQLSFAVGGGIVADSQADAEYAETFAKAAAIFQAVES